MNVIVVGGGAAGMMAAGTAAQKGHKVALYEKNHLLGKKISITGKGRCNVTNHTNVEGLLAHIPGNPYFLYSAFFQMDSERLQAFFQDLGVPTKVERGNRVFPVSDRSADIVKALEKYLRENHVEIHTNASVKQLMVENGVVKGICLQDGQRKQADGVIVCTGGLSYPKTGSTGDGYQFARSVGHTVTKLYPSLVPLKVKENWCSDLMGVSLKNVSMAVKENGKKTVYKDFGELLFTHFGLSGPLVLSASRVISIHPDRSYTVTIDLKPALDEKTLDLRLLRDFEKYANRDFKNSLDDLFPQKLIPVMVTLSQIPPEKKIHDITKEQRKNFCRLIKNLTMTITGTTGFSEAVITSGGISIEEINPSTMESKRIQNLYFAGEILDVDGYTGGFNLQIAFSTGYVAGSHILES